MSSWTNLKECLECGPSEEPDIVSPRVRNLPTDTDTDTELVSSAMRHNQATAIYRLPHDILFTIFQLITLEYIGSTSGSEPQYCTRESLDIARVSKRWREVALDTPRLWTIINQSIPLALIGTFLTRSRMAPLHIKLTDAILGVLEADSSHIAHIESLDTMKIDVTSALSLLQSPAPLLKKFRFSRARTLRKESWRGPMFADHTPRLRELQLHSACIPFTSSLYTGLTSLSLGGMSYNLSVQHLLQALEASPRLEYLYLIKLRFLHEGDTEPGFSRASAVQPIGLPMLVHLGIYHLKCDDAEPDESSCSTAILASLVLPPRAGLLQAPCSSIIFTQATRVHDNLQNIRRGPVQWMPFVSPVPDDPSELFRSLSPAFMSQLESLSLDWSECDLIRDFDINDYTALLSSATNLSNLCLRNDFCLASTVDPLLSTLIATPSTHLCPRLAKMEFTIDQGLSPSTMALLLEVVGSRRRAGGRRLRLRKVKLDFIVDRESVKKLRSLGIDVETYWWHMDPPILFSAFTPSQPFNRV